MVICGMVRAGPHARQGQLEGDLGMVDGYGFYLMAGPAGKIMSGQ